MPEYYEALRALCLSGSYQLAARELEKHLAQNPEDADSQALLCMALTRLERTKEAVEAGKQAIRLAPDSAWASYALAFAYKYNNNLGEAKVAVSNCLRLCASDPFSFSLASEIELELNQAERALELANRGLALDSNNLDCLNARAISLTRLNRLDEAEYDLDVALNLDPTRYFLYANKGLIALRRKQAGQACALYKTALKFKPQWKQGRDNIIMAAAFHDVALKCTLPLVQVAYSIIEVLAKAGQKLFIAIRPPQGQTDQEQSASKGLSDSSESLASVCLELIHWLIFVALGVVLFLPIILLGKGVHWLGDRYFDWALLRALKSPIAGECIASNQSSSSRFPV